jgi:hypothetical protein
LNVDYSYCLRDRGESGLIYELSAKMRLYEVLLGRIKMSLSL